MRQDDTMKVIHIARPRQAGGTIRSTLRQANAEHLAKRHVEVWSLLQTQCEEFKNIASQYEVPFLQISQIGCLGRLLATRLIRGKRLIVHLHSGRSTASPKARLLRRLLSGDSAFVLSLHGPNVCEEHFGRDWKRRHLKGCHCASAVIVPSEMEREWQIQLGIMPEKVFVVPGIIEFREGVRGTVRKQLSLDPETRIVLFCGRLEPQKSVIELIEAFRLVVADCPQAVLIIAGEGGLLSTCRSSMRGMDEKVFLLGHVIDVAPFYADADVFVAPSIAESFGIAAMEAALNRAPMVLGRIRPWTDYFKHEEACEFVDPKNPQDIAEAVLRILSNRGYAKRLSDNAYRIVSERFSTGAALDALSKAYTYAIELKVRE